MSDRFNSILYIEDNFDNRLLVKRILEAEGITVLEADNAVEGLKLINEKEPSLVLLDLNLPEIDGIVFTQFLRKDPQYETLPIVAITADLFRGSEERILSAGFDGYIQKPIDVDLLPSLIKRFLE
jgi:CheY-like chemotaxis protein